MLPAVDRLDAVDRQIRDDMPAYRELGLGQRIDPVSKTGYGIGGDCELVLRADERRARPWRARDRGDVHWHAGRERAASERADQQRAGVWAAERVHPHDALPAMNDSIRATIGSRA